MINSLRCLPVVTGLGPEDVGDERLRIAVIEREPARLDLHHDSMAGQEHMVRVRQHELVGQRLIGLYGAGGFEALAVAAAENVGGNHQLESAE